MLTHRRTLAAGAAVLVASLTVSLSSGALVGATQKRGAVAPAAKRMQYGMNTFVVDQCQLPYVWSGLAASQFVTFKKIGVNSLAITFPLYTDALNSNSVYAQDVCKGPHQTPTATRVAVLVDLAHKDGFKVLLRPVIDEASLRAQNPNNWRGLLAPTNLTLWFQNYLSTLRPYLIMAQKHHVESFAIQTELDSLSMKSNWSSAFTLARALYKGNMQFTMLWADKVAQPHWPGVSPGLDPYQWVLGVKNNATPATLLSSWNYDLTHQAKLPYGPSAVTLDEVGIPAQDGAFAQPYSWGLPLSSNPFNQTVQANWFTMACAFAKTHHMQGIYYWGANLNEGAKTLRTKPQSTTPLAIQPMSVAAIKKCFTGR